MSKAAQRKVSWSSYHRQTFLEGFMDARQNKGIKWLKHPFLKDYMRGYNKGSENDKTTN